MSILLPSGPSRAGLYGFNSRVELVSALNVAVTAYISLGLRYRDAVKRVAADKRIPQLEVRRLTRFHPYAP